MVPPPIPVNEGERLAALRSYGILDTPAEKDLDDVVALASHICEAAISQVTLVDAERQWFKASHGIEGATETPRDVSFCAHAINQKGLFVVPDAREDARFAANPLVTGAPHIRFYAGSPLVTPDGHALGTLCVIDRRPHEMTPHQKAALSVLGRLTMNHLEMRKQARELAGKERRLQAALESITGKNRELLEAANMKNRFLASMSHELRTPLNSIIGFSEILADGGAGAVNPDQKEYLGDILSSGRHLLSLINDILDLAKVEAGKMEVFPSPFALQDAVAEIGAVMRPQVMKKKLRFESAVAGDLPAVVLDVKLFKQMLFNLLSNAVKFTPEGGDVSLRIEAAGDGFFAVKVIDTGIGIRADDLGRLFREFEQLDGGPERAYQGTGLGLALTRRIARILGGDVSVESEFGKGSTFTALLPLEYKPSRG